MAKLITLKKQHKKSNRFDHPLLNDAIPYSEDELDFLTEAVIEGSINPSALTVSLRSCLRHIVGRYIANWPSTKRFKDEMVSEGFVALSELSSKISFDLLNGRSILKVASQRIINRIEKFLNSNQALTAASMRKQCYNISEGKQPIYCENVELDDLPESGHPIDDGDEWKRDALDCISKIECKDWLDEAILDRSNWGKKYQQLADELGVGVGTIHRRKARLYERFIRLMR